MSEYSELTNRIDRIETSISNLTEALVSIARAEEKIISVEKSNYANHERLNSHGDKIQELRIKTDSNEQSIDGIHRSIGFIQKFFWVLLTAMFGAAAAWFVGERNLSHDHSESIPLQTPLPSVTIEEMYEPDRVIDAMHTPMAPDEISGAYITSTKAIYQN